MQYEFQQSTSKTGWPVETLLIDVDTSGELWLENISTTLLQAIDVIAKAEECANEEKHWRMEFKLAPFVRIGERAMWSMIIESHSDVQKVLVNYLEKWCSIAQNSEMGFLPMYDEYQFVGEPAIAVFLSSLHYHDLLDAQFRAFNKVFVAYMYCCDFDFEVNQDDYISKVLVRMGSVDRDLKVALFCYRICCGQNSEKSFEYLNQFVGPITTTNQMLKAVIDYLIDHKDFERIQFEANEPRVYHELCAVAYGTEATPFTDTINYVASKIGEDIKNLPPYHQQRINDLKAQSDIERLKMNQPLDTGFHKYDPSVGNWAFPKKW